MLQNTIFNSDQTKAINFEYILDLFQTFDHQEFIKARPTAKSHSVVHTLINFHKVQEYWIFIIRFVFLIWKKNGTSSKRISTINILYKYYKCFVFLRPVSCVPNVFSVSGLSILDCPFGFDWRAFTCSSQKQSTLTCIL